MDPYKKYRRRKILFILILALIFISLSSTIFVLNLKKSIEPQQFVTAAICGCVKKPAVYRLPKGADLTSLIFSADGLLPNGDIRKVDLGTILKQDHVYHIPCRKEDIRTYIQKDELADFHLKYPSHNERLINYLYIGFPAVYLLIQYSTEYKLINIIYIPHSTVFMNNEYRIIDFYFTLGIGPTLNILKNRINQHIDYYFIQNQSSFITMIDELGGIEINIDRYFAETYDLTPGLQILDGWHTYEYIRFIDQKRHFSARGNSKSLEDLQIEVKDIELAFIQREQRQRNVIYSLHKKFNENKNKTEEVNTMIKAILDKGTVDSNLDFSLSIDIFRLLMQGTEISYGTLPGVYKNIDGNIYYIPEGPGYELLRKNEVRELFELNKSTNSQTLY